MKQSRWVTLLAWGLALVVGGFSAFFVIGPALFADGGAGERMLVLGLSVPVFGAIGAALGLVAPWAWRSTGILLAVPLVAVGVLFGLETPVLAALFVLSDAAAAVFGSWGGARMRLRKRTT